MEKELLNRLQSELKKREIDAWILSSSERFTDPHLPWLIGENLNFRNLFIIPKNGSPFFVVSSLDQSLIKKKRRVFDKKEDFNRILSSFPFKKVALSFSKKGIDGLTHRDFLLLKKNLTAKIVPADFLVEVRKRKTKNQIKNHKKAAKKTEEVFEALPELLKKNSTEASLRESIDELLKEPAFPSIVATGPNTKNPHHRPTNKKIKNNDLLLIDIGAKVENACADLTRTFSIGKPKKSHSELYLQIREALSNLISLSLPDSKISKLPRSLPFKMIHSIGHSIGLEPHDVGLSFSENSKDIFKPGNVIALEPAIYKKRGIRIEDNILITKKKPKLLSNAPEKIPMLKF